MYRSRLQKIEEKRNVKKAAWLVIITMGIIAALVMWGVPLLVRVAVILGDLNASRRPISKTDLIPPPAPTLLLPYEATNSATLTVKGWSEPGSTVYLTVNSEVVGSVLASEAGNFELFDVGLSTGQNDIVAVAVDQAGNKSLESVPARLGYYHGEPELEIESPVTGQTITGGEKEVEIKGTTGAGSRLTVNDRLVVVAPDGRFNYRHALNEGENVVVIKARDGAGNEARRELTITYTP